MSALRPETISGGDRPVPTDGTAYLLIYNAVKRRHGLIHGRLDDGYGAHCAIGSFFEDQPKLALYCSMIDEVAAVNDSVPSASRLSRQRLVMRWLRWKLAQVGLMSQRYLKKKAAA